MQNFIKAIQKKYLVIIVFFMYAILTTSCSKDKPSKEKGDSQYKIIEDIVTSPELIVDVDVNSEVVPLHLLILENN